MDRRIAVASAVGIAVVAYSIGYRQGVRSMVINWQRAVVPSLSGYLAARDVAEQIMGVDDDED